MCWQPDLFSHFSQLPVPIYSLACSWVLPPLLKVAPRARHSPSCHLPGTHGSSGSSESRARSRSDLFQCPAALVAQRSWPGPHCPENRVKTWSPPQSSSRVKAETFQGSLPPPGFKAPRFGVPVRPRQEQGTELGATTRVTVPAHAWRTGKSSLRQHPPSTEGAGRDLDHQGHSQPVICARPKAALSAQPAPLLSAPRRPAAAPGCV